MNTEGTSANAVTGAKSLSGSTRLDLSRIGFTASVLTVPMPIV